MSQVVQHFCFWRHAAIAPHRNHLLHDFISRDFFRSLQYGIVVFGFLDAYVYAHHKHRQVVRLLEILVIA